MGHITLKTIVLYMLILITSAAVNAQSNLPQENTDRMTEKKPYKIGIPYTEPHAVLTTIINAFKETVLAKLPDAIFIERHGSGSDTQYPSVIRSLIAENVDLLAPITTPMSKKTLEMSQGRIPVVFLGVTDPVTDKLVNSLDKPDRCTGVSDNPPMNEVVDLIRIFYPNANCIGIPYDPSDPPGVITANRAKEYAESIGYTVKMKPVTMESELRAVVRSLCPKSDALVIGMDNMMMPNAGLVSRTAMDYGTPLFAADDKSVEMGAIAGIGIDYTDIGVLGGEIAVEVLTGKREVGNIPVQTLSKGKMFYNEKAIKELNIDVSNVDLNKGVCISGTEK